MAVGQSINPYLTHRHRQQAPSHSLCPGLTGYQSPPNPNNPKILRRKSTR